MITDLLAVNLSGLPKGINEKIKIVIIYGCPKPLCCNLSVEEMFCFYFSSFMLLIHSDHLCHFKKQEGDSIKVDLCTVPSLLKPYDSFV